MGGCIVGECPVCNELVLGDELSDKILIHFEEFVHDQCVSDYKKSYFKEREIKEIYAFLKDRGLMKEFHDYQEKTRKKQEQIELF